MVTKWKSFSHSVFAKVLSFCLAVLFLTGAVKVFFDVGLLIDGHFGIVFEHNYFASRDFVEECDTILGDLTDLVGKYKNEDHILQGALVTEERLRTETRYLWTDIDFYSPETGSLANYQKFKELYPDEVAAVRDRLIKEDLKEYHALRQRLAGYEGMVYYADDGENVYTNSPGLNKGHFQSYPAYLAAEKYNVEFSPAEIGDNDRYYWLIRRFDRLEPAGTTLYLAFTEDYLNDRIREWERAKAVTQKGLWQVGGLLLGFFLAFTHLAVTAGRSSFEDKEAHLHTVDRLYNDVKLGLIAFLLLCWGISVAQLFDHIQQVILPLTVPAVFIGLLLVLSLVRHYKNGTLIGHTLLYRVIDAVCRVISRVYASGSIGVKTVAIVILYSVLVALSFFIAPVTIGLGAWLAFRQAENFRTIRQGVERIKNGDIRHIITVSGNGELAQLAADINSITGGLQKAVENELKSERLKTELITNVSHDIRTPLTSIITYVDLLKQEEDPAKAREYIETLDQKAKRLKTLIDDLFEAAKASSGNIPVNIEKIDIVSLVTQGLGEVNDQIEAAELEFRLRHPQEKLYVAADGRLLWRSIENLLSNIFKYALRGSRVYVDIEDRGSEVLLTFKNISAYELNISPDELMERFKRGDEARTSEGSGLGLSIAKSLIDLQKGKFSIQIDGDLFKVTVAMPKYNTIACS